MQRLVIASSALFILAAASSGCGMGQEDARATWSSVKSSLASDGQALNISFDADEVPCENGGSLALELNLAIGEGEEGVPEGAAASFGYDITYDECQPDENTLDGNLEYAAVVTTESSDTEARIGVVYIYRGTIVVSGEENGTCEIDVQGYVSADAAGSPGDEFSATVDMDYTGTICGEDAHEALNADADDSDI